MPDEKEARKSKDLGKLTGRLLATIRHHVNDGHAVSINDIHAVLEDLRISVQSALISNISL